MAGTITEKTKGNVKKMPKAMQSPQEAKKGES
jgi:hypothetical protein